MRRTILATLAVLAVGAVPISAASAAGGASASKSTAVRMSERPMVRRTAAHPVRRAPRRAGMRYEPGVTGSIARPAPAMGPELWPPCPYGTPTCTAAGYPNLRTLREIQGGY